MQLCVILPAAGFSGRYLQQGGVRGKLDEDLGGKPLLQRTVEVFSKFDDDDITISSILVAGPHEEAAWREFKDRHADRMGLLGATLVRGGVTHRWETVAAALAHAPLDCSHIAVHDAARPCITHELLQRVFRAAKRFDAVLPAVPVHDTIKSVRTTDRTMGGDDPVAAILGESAASKLPVRVVEKTIPRDGVVLVQTPQVFKAELLKQAYAHAPTLAQRGAAITDDASLVEALGTEVVIVEGDPRNIKVTVPADLELARRIMNLKEPEGRAVHKRF